MEAARILWTSSPLFCEEREALDTVKESCLGVLFGVFQPLGSRLGFAGWQCYVALTVLLVLT